MMSYIALIVILVVAGFLSVRTYHTFHRSENAIIYSIIAFIVFTVGLAVIAGLAILYFGGFRR